MHREHRRLLGDRGPALAQDRRVLAAELRGQAGQVADLQAPAGHPADLDVAVLDHQVLWRRLQLGTRDLEQLPAGFHGGLLDGRTHRVDGLGAAGHARVGRGAGVAGLHAHFLQRHAERVRRDHGHGGVGAADVDVADV